MRIYELPSVLFNGCERNYGCISAGESYFKIHTIFNVTNESANEAYDALYDVELYFSIRVKYLRIPRTQKHSRASGFVR